MKFVLIAALVLGLAWYLSQRAGVSRRNAAPELPPRSSNVTTVRPAASAAAEPAQRSPQAASAEGRAAGRVQAGSSPAKPAPANRSPALRKSASVNSAEGRPSSVRVLPPGTRDLDDPDAIRPDIDARALASARAAVTPAVPDAVLSDALLDASPEQLGRLFAAVPTDVMNQALGRHAVHRDDVAPLRAEDRQQLSGLGDALDDLDIWNLGEDSAKA